MVFEFKKSEGSWSNEINELIDLFTDVEVNYKSIKEFIDEVNLLLNGNKFYNYHCYPDGTCLIIDNEKPNKTLLVNYNRYTIQNDFKGIKGEPVIELRLDNLLLHLDEFEKRCDEQLKNKFNENVVMKNNHTDVLRWLKSTHLVD